MSFSFEYPYPAPSTKGWGPGWPNCQRDKLRTDGVGALFVGGVHEDIFELVTLLVAECERRGFRFITPGCWGFGCRAVKTSDGDQGDTPSVHSWGLALDINAPLNVFGSDKSESQIATDFIWLPVLFRDFGFYWLGPPIEDWMHFHFAGSPADAVAMTIKARRELAGKEDDAMFEEWRTGWQRHEDGREFNPDWPQGIKDGWRDRDRVLRDARSS